MPLLGPAEHGAWLSKALYSQQNTTSRQELDKHILRGEPIVERPGWRSKLKSILNKSQVMLFKFWLMFFSWPDSHFPQKLPNDSIHSWAFSRDRISVRGFSSENLDFRIPSLKAIIRPMHNLDYSRFPVIFS